MRNCWLLPIALLILAPGAFTGCQREEKIEYYVVPRVETMPAVQAVGKKEPVRFLGAILPAKDEVWFLKLVGPEATVTPLAEPFEKFVKTIRFTGKVDSPVWIRTRCWRPNLECRSHRFLKSTVKRNSVTRKPNSCGNWRRTGRQSL